MRNLMMCLVMALLCATPVHAQADHYRSGLWGGISLGWSSLGCLDGCNDRSSGVGGVARIGGTLSPEVRLAVGTNTWNKSVGGSTLQVGSIEGQVHWFPGAGDGFLYAGLGLGYTGVDLYSLDNTSGAATVGVGWTLNLGEGRKVALVPEISWTVLTSSGQGNFLQASFGFIVN